MCYRYKSFNEATLAINHNDFVSYLGLFCALMNKRIDQYARDISMRLGVWIPCVLPHQLAVRL